MEKVYVIQYECYEHEIETDKRAFMSKEKAEEKAKEVMKSETYFGYFIEELDLIE